jgi:hypothetical protein
MSISRALADVIRATGGDPTEPAWEWLVLRGPHGEAFTWAQTKNQAPGYVGVEHLEQIVTERQDADPTFRSRARDVAKMALSSTDIGLLRRGIQVAAVVGAEAELRRVVSLANHENVAVVGDAKAGAFYLKRRLKRGEQKHDA